MNQLVKAITSLDESAARDLIEKLRWRSWAEPTGKNALHYLCGISVKNDAQAQGSLRMLKLLLKSGLDINSIHRIEDKNCDVFPATPLWYAYTRGRNEKLYKYLLKQGAKPDHCWWAIAWYDDVAAAKLWLKHGAVIGKKPSVDDLFLGAFQWKKMAFAKWLLSQGADVNARGPAGMTALMLAVKRKDQEAIRWLIEAGGDPDQKSDQKFSARTLAELNGPKRIMTLLSNDT
jgi:ankyrin repeat protein